MNPIPTTCPTCGATLTKHPRGLGVTVLACPTHGWVLLLGVTPGIVGTCNPPANIGQCIGRAIAPFVQVGLERARAAVAQEAV